MNKLLAVPLLGCALMAACTSMHTGEMEGEEGDEVKVPMDQVPAAVRATFAREAPGVSISQVDKESEKGQITYEADAMIGGKNWEIRVAEDGKLISKKEEKEEKEGEQKEEKGK